MSKLTFTKADRFTTHAIKGGVMIAIISTQDGVSVRLVGNPVPYLFANVKGAKAFVALKALSK